MNACHFYQSGHVPDDDGNPNYLYENTVDGGSAVQFEVVVDEGATALGATVTVSAGGEEATVVRQTDESDFLSQESRALHVGLGNAETATPDVTWPDSMEGSFEVDADARYRVAPDGVEQTANLTSANGEEWAAVRVRSLGQTPLRRVRCPLSRGRRGRRSRRPGPASRRSLGRACCPPRPPGRSSRSPDSRCRRSP